MKYTNDSMVAMQNSAQERWSLVLLVSATVLCTVSAVSYSWFELTGVARYGIWLAAYEDLNEVQHFVPAFFTNEPALYHLLQLLFLLSWALMGLATMTLASKRVKLRLPRLMLKYLTKQNGVALMCFLSVFTMTSLMYLFYYIVNEFPREQGKYPEMIWASKLAAVACGMEFFAGLLLLQT